jgi:ArsR family transcriptional regulator
VDIIQIYQCFCDETRLRILHLLSRGPLCVCHFQALLEEPQVKISKHLAYLKDKGLVEAQRHQNWMIYRLPLKPPPELQKNLLCLQDCVQTHPVFKMDLKRLKSMSAELKWLKGALSCCPQEPALPRSAARFERSQKQIRE